MNGDLNVLNDLLVEDILVTFGEKDGRRFAYLKEHGSDAKLKRVKILDIPENSILIHMDRYDQPKTLFRNEKGQRQRCDYVLLTKLKNRRLMLFIEMKSSSVSNSKIQKQFRGAECVMDYCNAALNRFHGQMDLFSSFQKRFVLFFKPHSIHKRPTRYQGISQINDTPEKVFKYPAPQNPSLKSLVWL